MAGIFKAYDIRGIVTGDDAPLTPQRAYLIGRGLAERVFAQMGPIALTHDMRTHSPELYGELSRGLSEGGCSVIEVGLAATPMNYWAINQYAAQGGVQVTASHNGPEYNGFKVSGRNAAPFDFVSGLNMVEDYVLSTEKAEMPAPVEHQGEVTRAENVLRDYLDWMNKYVVPGTKTLKIGIDAGNGMGGLFLPDFFAGYPQWEVTPLYFELDGNFPNHEADPLKPENLEDVQKLVRDNGLDFGVAYDGDADRCMFVDENGDSISSDLITALIAAEIIGEQPGAAILYDLRSSHVVPEWIKQHGGVPYRGRVGHSFMKRLMKDKGAMFGGELSGHYYFAACFNTDSGLMAMIKILNLLSNSDKKLSEHVAPLRRYAATGEINYRVGDVDEVLAKVKKHFGDAGAKFDELDGLTVQNEGWWFNLRSSNTEPLLRLNLEAADAGERDAHLKEVQGVLGAEPVTGH